MMSRAVEIFTNNFEADGDSGIQTDPLVLRVSLDGRQPTWFEAGNIYALETWRPMGTGQDIAERVADNGFVHQGLYKTIAEARAGYEALLEKQGPPTCEQMVEEQEPIVMATGRAMSRVIAKAMQAAGVSLEQQEAVVQEVTRRRQSERFTNLVVRELQDLQAEALIELFIGDLDSAIQQFLDIYDDCLRGPYVSDQTNYEAHEPRDRMSVADCLEGLKAVLHYADSHNDDSLSDYQRALAEETLGRKSHEFQPHWLDTLRAEGQRVGWDTSHPHHSRLLDISPDNS